MLEVNKYQENHTENLGNSSSIEENLRISTPENNIETLFNEASYDKNPLVRWKAIVALSKIGGPAAINALMKALNDDSYYICRKAARLLIESDGVPQPRLSNLKYLMKLLSSEDERIIEAIIKIGVPSIEMLTTALDDDSFFIRRNVAQTLARFIHGIIVDQPRGMDLSLFLASRDFSLMSIADLFDLRIRWEKNLVNKVETTNFETVSRELRGTKIIELSNKDIKGLELLKHWRDAEAKTIDFENILSDLGAIDFDVKGRTLTTNVGKCSLAIKLGVRPGDGKKLLTESIIQDFFDSNGRYLGLSSKFPHPIRIEKSGFLPFRLSGIPFDLMKRLGLCSDPLAICYLADSEYFRYLNDPLISVDEMGNSLILCSKDLAKLTKFGLIHTAIIPLFHNREQINTRIDQGLYNWWAKVAGRLDRWRESCQYPNLRLSGLADFEHVEFCPQISSEELQHIIGNQLLSISLILGSYFRNRGQFNQKALSKLLKDCFLNYHRELTNKCLPIDNCIDWDYLAFRMNEEMGEDKYMTEIIRGLGPHGEKVERSTGPHLGLFNGPFPLPELIRATYIISLFAVLEMQGALTFYSRRL